MANICVLYITTKFLLCFFTKKYIFDRKNGKQTLWTGCLFNIFEEFIDLRNKRLDAVVYKGKVGEGGLLFLRHL